MIAILSPAKTLDYDSTLPDLTASVARFPEQTGQIARGAARLGATKLGNLMRISPKLAQLMSQITRYAPESVFPTITGWPEKSNKHHRRLLDALEKHDEDLARTEMSAHLAAGAKPLIDHLTSRGVVT